ncbi:MAG TPA: radical SAM protein [Pyrinomonadaceae bacterium]|jgi:radical SAM superfamily enzyme YgiQ (UPF0313 family)
MMKVCLISPPTVTDFEDPTIAESEAIRLIAEHAPVGILSLAAVLEARGIAPTIIDLNRRYYEYLRSDAYGQIEFDSFVCQGFAAERYDVIGFSTICSSYPLTLRIARDLKAAHPDTLMILGGPQASVVDVPTMKEFPDVDFIVRGEAEESFPALLDAIQSGAGGFESIMGITFRRGGEVVRNPNAPVIHDLDSLPLPAFHLYPHIEKCHYVPLELGRGCPFACSFCSTNDFFRRNFRLKSPAQLIRQMKHIKETYGINTFDLIHDMFTVDKRKVVAFCEALLASGEQFVWNCSARTDCISEDLIALMAKAGCRGIFFGIETGSARLQPIIKKNLDLAEAERMIECASKHRVTTAVSLIYGFPDENMDDVRDTIAFFVDSLRHDYSVPQLHILAPLAETPIHAAYRKQMVFDDVLSDMSHQGWRQALADRQLIDAYPDIFPNFYAVPTPHLDRQYLKELRDFVLKGMRWFRWLLVALHQDSGDLVKVFDAWRPWRVARQAEAPLDSIELSIYYGTPDFSRDFLEFVTTGYLDKMAKATHVVAALLEYENAIGNNDPTKLDETTQVVETQAGPAAEPAPPLSLRPEIIPHLAAGVRVAQVSVDYKKIINCLRRKGRLKRLSARPVLLATRATPQKTVDVLQLTPLSARLLSLCDGARNVREITSLFAAQTGEVASVRPDQVCIFGLEMLRLQNLIVASTEPAAASTVNAG